MKVSYEKIEAFIESKGASVVAALAAVISFVVYRKFTIDNETIVSLQQALLTVFAITVGFLMTTKSILFSIGSSKAMKRLRDAGYQARLVKYLFTATWSSMAAVLLTIIAILVDFVSDGLLIRAYFALWIGVMLHALTTCLRTIWIFKAIMSTALD